MKEMQLTSTIHSAISNQNTAANKVHCTHPKTIIPGGKKLNITPQTDKSWKLGGTFTPQEAPQDSSNECDQTVFMFDRNDVESVAQMHKFIRNKQIFNDLSVEHEAGKQADEPE